MRQFLASPVPFVLGEISFGIFAIHMFVLVNGMRVMNIEVFTGEFTLVLLMVSTVTLVLAGVSYYGFERRVLRLKNRGPFVPRGNQRSKARDTAHAA